jgi:tRNA threonylcarbamoyl adenosine modification protein YeaZ
LDALLEGVPVEEIIIGVGPGSYTGIRVGVAVARGLAYAWKVPLIGAPSLCSFIPDEEGPFAVVVDAKVGGIYLQQGNKEKNLTWEGECRLVPPEDWEDAIEGRTIVTPYATPLQKRLSHCEIHEVLPSPKELLRVAREKPLPCEILYLRKTQAEQERER